MRNENKDVIETTLHPRNYTIDEVYRIINPKQHQLYVKNKARPIDMYSSIDKNGKDITVYVYLREDVKDLYQAWNNFELE